MQNNIRKYTAKLASNNKNGFKKNIIAYSPTEKYIGKRLNKEKAEKFIEKNIKNGHLVVLALSYEVGFQQMKLQAKNTTENEPKFIILAYKDFEFFKKTRNKSISDNHKSNHKSEFKTTLSKSKYIENFNKIKKYLEKGHIYQINFTQKLLAKTKKTGEEIFNTMLCQSDSGFLAHIKTDHLELISGSPERFLNIKGKKIETMPIKGTRPRGKTRKEDQNLKNELKNSEKETAELNMITDLLRNDLGQIAETGSVKVKKTREITGYKTIWHASSHITATLKNGISHLSALLSMFPGGSITGCPKKRAMEIIDEIENYPRGFYTGCIGYFYKDTAEFSIAIRTMVKKKNIIELAVGGGIVIDSNMEAEYKENFQKAEAFTKIL